MAKKGSGKKRAKKAKDEATPKWARALERRLVALDREHRVLRRRVKRLTRAVEALPPPPPFGPGSFSPPGRRPWRGPPPGGPKGGPWGRGFGPTVSLEVPLETDDPAAPLWATVNARLPEEITTVGDEGEVVRYRYSAAGSTPQAPRYRRLREPELDAPD